MLAARSKRRFCRDSVGTEKRATDRSVRMIPMYAFRRSCKATTNGATDDELLRFGVSVAVG